MGVGTHVLAELYQVPPEKLARVPAVRELMYRVVREGGFNAVGETFHQFEPHGVTGIILLSESHLSIHTWPEKRMLAADIFACSGRGDALLGLKLLQKYFTPGKMRHKVIQR